MNVPISASLRVFRFLLIWLPVLLEVLTQILVLWAWHRSECRKSHP